MTFFDCLLWKANESNGQFYICDISSNAKKQAWSVGFKYVQVLTEKDFFRRHSTLVQGVPTYHICMYWVNYIWLLLNCNFVPCGTSFICRKNVNLYLIKPISKLQKTKEPLTYWCLKLKVYPKFEIQFLYISHEVFYFLGSLSSCLFAQN